MQDISARVEAEKSLRQAARVFESTAEGVVITGPDERILTLSKAFTEITGYSEDEVLGETPRILKSGRHHAELGPVPPSRFIPLAEDIGMIDRLGAWVLEERCRQVTAWDRDGFRIPRLAVNLSVHQLEGRRLLEQVRRALADADIAATRLELEITESSDDAIVRATLALGESLGLETIAEGVETEAQADFLRQADCLEAQGFLFGQPLPSDALAAAWA